MKEQYIYYQDNEGITQSMSIVEYERIRTSESGEQEAPQGKNTGFPVRETGRKDTPETNNPKPI